ncbi:MAG: phospholipase [Geobacteraceae bacterium]|nr:phospholipase [Geobacteraceae bacterium]
MRTSRLLAALTLSALLTNAFILPSFSFCAEKVRNSKVTLLQDHKYVDALISGIRSAKREITGCFFLFKVSDTHSSLPMAIVRELVAAKNRGVEVTIELEQDAGKKRTVYEQNRRAASLMADAGIKVRFDTPRTVTHVKAMVIDRRFLYVGSHNLTQSALKYNNELSVMIDSPELSEEVLSYLNNL